MLEGLETVEADWLLGLLAGWRLDWRSCLGWSRCGDVLAVVRLLLDLGWVGLEALDRRLEVLDRWLEGSVLLLLLLLQEALELLLSLVELLLLLYWQRLNTGELSKDWISRRSHILELVVEIVFPVHTVQRLSRY